MRDSILSLSANLSGKQVFKEFSNFPPVLRDLSVVAESSVKQSQILETILASKHQGLLKNIRLYDIFELKGEDTGKKSYTYSLEFRSDEKTLTNEEINKIQDSIVADLGKKLGAGLRK
jgi:phenylalanyl-tRNA synthetase beta chain